MIYIRKSNTRGKSHNPWLNSLHTFSFAEYYDPGFMGYGSLRVINEDTVQPGKGFAEHPHRDMEIISYVISGSLEHKDSMGTGSVIKSGEIQIMSAGDGVEHSELNHSKTNNLHFLQIWIIPNKADLKPRYEQKTIKKTDNQLILIGARDAQEGAVVINQDVDLYVAYLTKNNAVKHNFAISRKGWLQLIKGKIQINDQELSFGDGAAIQAEESISIKCTEDAEFLLFDLGMH